MAAYRPPRADPKAAIADWLDLVDPDGAFLTTTELVAAFPHGFEPIDTDLRSELRSRVADLSDDQAARTELRRWLLGVVLAWDDLLVEDLRVPATAHMRSSEEGVALSPAMALLDADDQGRVRVGVFIWPAGTPLDRRVDGGAAADSWIASPIQRAETWCRESGVPLAMVTDDDQWSLVWAPKGAPAASCRWGISDLADERVLQAGLVSLLGSRRFFAVGEDETLEELFRSASDSEAAVTKGLGRSVRRSVELLVAAISRDDVASEGRMLDGVAPPDVYESAVTVLMRVVFLLFAEERRLLPAEDQLWADSYSVLTLRNELRAAALRDGEDALERRSTAWHRLLATSRAVHGGANHDRLTLPAYGGSLFDPERFPFLEGRRAPDRLAVGETDLGPVDDDDTPVAPGRPIAIDDRTVLAILDALLNVQVGSGRRTVTQRVSYKALDVEQIGHCYEGLLDHGCSPVELLTLGLVGSDGAEPEIAISDLESQIAGGSDALCEWLSDKTRCNRSVAALAKDLGRKPEAIDIARLRVACGNDDAVTERVLPFWGLIRLDLRDLPVVLLPGSMFVTQTSTRRNMGAQYTTKALAEEVVQYALEPLVFDPGPQNEADPEKWVPRRPEDILALKVCDPAVGSGAILTAAGRYLADRLIKGVDTYGPGVGALADRLADLAAAPAEEQVVMARREVVDHCLYGVDKSPVAAEMAKLSLWLTTMARERPFTFLDHAIQVGDSLLGITDVDQLRWLHLDPGARKGAGSFSTLAVDRRLAEATELARRLQALSVVTVRDAAEKRRLHEELKAKLADLSVVADTVVGAALSTAGKRGPTMEQRLDIQLERIRTALDEDSHSELERSAALRTLEGTAAAWLRTDLPDDIPDPSERHCLHWPLAFPEVFLDEGRKGFDAMVANPPFLGGKRISGAMGTAVREHLLATIAEGAKGTADLVAYFLLRERRLTSSIGTLATNTVSQGDSREVGLDRLVADGWTIYRAVQSEPWPNEANVEVAKIWMTSNPYESQCVLDGRRVKLITSSLGAAGRVEGLPVALHANRGIGYQGMIIGSLGFVLGAPDAERLLRTPSGRLVRSYLGGADLNSDPTQQAARLVIDFSDANEATARKYAAAFDHLTGSVQPEVLAKRGYPGWSARWWQFWNLRPALRARLEGRRQVLAMARVSGTLQPAWVNADQVFHEKVNVFIPRSEGLFGLLACGPHYWWTVRWSSTLGAIGNINYSLSDAFETFPQPEPQEGAAWELVEAAGRTLNEFRKALMARNEQGLTKTYSRMHDPEEDDSEIAHLRELQVSLDHAVRDAYGWSKLPLDHHHWETPQGMRFTVSPEAKDELLDRLLELNHERYAAEVADGLHDTKGKKSVAKKRKASGDQGSLL